MTDYISRVKAFSQRPYYDDFDVDKKFLQMLFRPGLAVQARELTQIQTILQEQVSRVGSHFFDNGARIIGGETKISKKIQYVTLPNTYSPSANHDFTNAKIIKVGSTLEGKIVHTEYATSTDELTFYVEYVSSDDTVSNFVSGDSVEIYPIDITTGITVLIPVTQTLSTVGYGALAYVNDGIYFINGRFVVVNTQAIVISKYTDITASENQISVGFLITDTIVTPEEDSSLYDNAIGSSNESAPGATRYVMDVKLVLKSSITNDQLKDFVQIIQVVTGEASQPVQLTDYSQLFLDIFARRTYDESGDYIVDDFLLDIQEHLNDGSNNGRFSLLEGGDADLVSLKLDPGKAYVRGYEVAIPDYTLKSTSKARTTENIEDIFISNAFDSYVYVTFTGANVFPVLFTRGTTVNLKASSTTLFTAVMQGIEEYSTGKYKIYFTDLTATTNTSNISNVTHLEQSGFNAIVDAGVSTPFVINTSKTNLTYKIPYSLIKTITDAVFFEYKTYTSIVDADGISIVDNTVQLSSNVSDYVVNVDGVFMSPTGIQFGNSNSIIIEMTNGITDGTPATILAKVARNSYIPITKTPTTITENAVTPDPLTKNIILSNTDGIRVVSVIGATSGINYTSKYVFDNGQTTTAYNYCKLVPSQGHLKFASSENMNVTYEYFAHGGVGDFFTVDSYINGGTAYEDIPSFNGEFLGNMIDLRKSITANTTKIVPNFIILDYTYYLSRKDLIILDKKGVISVVEGIPSLTPKLPAPISDSITLYELSIPAYTFSSSDISVNKLNYKRYTMKDISNLEKRVENLEYYTQLNLLESNLQGKEFLDKFKSGYIVDNFDSLTTSDTETTLHAIAIDFDKKTIRPEAITREVNMRQLSINNAINNSGVITMNYTSVPYIKQELASTIERIQPFAKFNWDGNCLLTPSFENYFSWTTVPDLTIDTGLFPRTTPDSTVQQKVWDVVSRAFVGNEFKDKQGTVTVPVDGAVQTVRGFQGQDVVVGSQRLFANSSWFNRNSVSFTAATNITSQTQFAGTRILDVGMVPFIRSRWIQFNISGLKPNTRVKPYFDGTDMSAYCHQVSLPTDTPNSGLLGNTLTSNGAGVLIGYMFIPNTAQIRFKTGSRKFKVEDSATNPSTGAEAVFTASGTEITAQNVFVTTRRFTPVNQVWVNNSGDPIAQSFRIANKEGAFITSLDIFFGPYSNNLDDVWVEIRDMVNGYPGINVLARKRLKYNELANGSSDATIATTFTFDYPVYIEGDKEFCFVVQSNSTSLSVWTSKLGERAVRAGDVGIFTGEFINKQPYLGSMFKSQNNTTWTAEQTQDIKFTINRAKFSLNDATVSFKNQLNTNDVGTEADPYIASLSANPMSTFYGLEIEITNGGSGYTSPVVNITGGGGVGATATANADSNGKIVSITVTNNGSGYTSNPTISITGTSGSGASATGKYSFGDEVTVQHKNNGYSVGDKVTISGVTGTVGTYSSANLNAQHTITRVTTDTYSFIPASGTNTITAIGGGTTVKATQQLAYSAIRILSDAIVLNGTTVGWRRNGKSFVPGADTFSTPIVEGKTVELERLNVVKANNDETLTMTATLTTSSDFLSPVIDEQRLCVYVTSNRINTYNDDTGNKSIARYPTKPISIINPANEIQVYLDNNIPSGTKVDVYCMVATEPVNIDSTNYAWNKMTVVSGGGYTDINEFIETKYLYESNTDFTHFVIKIVYSTTATYNKYTTIVPQSKRFRAIALKN